jgi:hypothetical protein
VDVRLVIVEGPNQGRSFDLGGSLVLGRDTSAGIVLEDPEASRRHASVSAEGEAVTLEDLGSTNGTFVNGERIEGPRTLQPGDKVRIGTTVLECQGTGPAVTRVAAAIPDPEATRMGQARPDLSPEAPTDVQPPEPAATPPVPEPGPPPAPEPPVPEPPAPEPPAPEPFAQPPAPEPGPPPAPEPGPPPPPEPVGAPAPPEAGPPPPPPGGEAFPPPPPGPGAPGGFEPQAPPAPPGMPPAPPAGGPPVAYQQADYSGRPDYPIDLQADYPHNGIARWRCFFQNLLAIPHFFLIFFYAIAAWFYIIVAWFTVLFTGRFPPNAFNFLSGFYAYVQRFTAYTLLMTEAYPPFDTQPHPEYPIRTRIEPPPEGRVANWRPLASWLLVIPHTFVLSFVFFGVFFALIGAWFSILFTRRFPPGIFGFVTGALRWNLRATAYQFFMTERYPPFSLE